MNDRHEKIYQLLNKNGSVSMALLKEEIYASEATIRRDLAKMEAEGLLIRTWGGAIAANGMNCDPPSFVRSNANVNEKNAIARIAMTFLQNNMTIFLASGTTVTRFASHFQKHQNITVITNGLDTANVLKNHPHAKIIMLGGALHENYDLIGNITETVIEQLNADIFFFSCSGITAEGFTSMDMERLNIIKKMKKNSSKTILLCDTSKVGKKYTYRGFDFDEIDFVVMESKPNDPALRKILGKKLITSKTIFDEKKQEIFIDTYFHQPL